MEGIAAPTTAVWGGLATLDPMAAPEHGYCGWGGACKLPPLHISVKVTLCGQQ